MSEKLNNRPKIVMRNCSAVDCNVGIKAENVDLDLEDTHFINTGTGIIHSDRSSCPVNIDYEISDKPTVEHPKPTIFKIIKKPISVIVTGLIIAFLAWKFGWTK